MAIEFRCPQCQKLLRTGDDTAGRQAQCPGCAAIIAVPNASETDSSSTPPVGVIASPGNPFSNETPSPGPQDFNNPYRSPMNPSAMPASMYPAMRESAVQRVKGPAIGLIVTAALGFVLQVANIGFAVMQLGVQNVHNAHMNHNPFAEVPAGFTIVQSLVAIVLGVVVLIGALKMMNLKSYGLAMTAAIAAMIPCVSPCCLLGLPFGIWAIVVLSDSMVKAAFSQSA